MKTKTCAVTAAMIAAWMVLGGGAAGQTVVVDGDLTDLAAAAQATRLDPINEVCPLGRSGYDFEAIHVFYDLVSDTLFVGLDLMDVVPGGDGIGIPGPGVPGDIDGDGDPNVGSNEMCGSFDQPGVGPDEQYLVKVDTDTDFDTGGAEDLRILYRANLLTFERGNGTPLAGVSGAIVLGTAGAPVDPLMPNQNRLTEDIEIAVHGWSEIDATPGIFAVSAFSGSALDGLSEDLIPLFVVAIDSVTCRFGRVDLGASEAPQPVLRVNGSVGDETRTVAVPVNGALEIFMDAAPAGPSPGPFVLYVWTHVPDETTVTPHPFGLGPMCLPSPITGGAPQPVKLWNNVGKEGILGTPSYPSVPAPSIVASRPTGWPTPVTATLQGILADLGSSANRPGSLTNAIVLRIQ